MKSSYDKPLLLAIVIGIILSALVFSVSTESEKKEGLSVINETLDFMKTQCARYDNQIATSETKSQVALLDKMHELARQLSEAGISDMEKVVSEYIENQRMSGVILLDEEGEYLTGAFCDDETYENWTDILLDDDVLQVMDYPQKNYLSHVENVDGTVYDYVAISMEGQKGLIFGYIREGENEIADRESGIINMLTGYQIEMGGIMVITRGERILTTNTDDYPDIDICKEVQSNTNGEEIVFNGKQYLAGSASSADYKLYAFFPTYEIYRQRSVILSYVLVFYIFFVMMFLFARQRSIQKVEGQRLKFLRQMSHDIRTPINGIRGMIRIANSCPKDLEKQEVCRQKIWEASDLLIDLVNDVLDMGKLDSGETHLEEKPFDMKELAENAIAVAEGAAEHRGIKIILEKMEGKHWHLIGSPAHVSRILNNILGNAIKYNKDNGVITLSCREIIGGNDEGKTSFELICADTGIGMDRGFQKHMFEQFTQENVMDEVSHHGTGLGLSIVKSIVDQMQGTIRCESKRDEGTTFTVVLPFVIDPDAIVDEEKISESQNVSENSLNGVSVLLVEDNEMNMEIAEFILEDMGMKITKAWNGQEAVKIFSESKPFTFDIILMDMMMPVMNGEEATRAIRKLDRPDAKTIPIVAATANAFAEDIEAALASGMNDHLAKPLDEMPLRQMITKYVAVSQIA